MFNDVDESLRSLLIADMPVERNEIDVVFDRPTREWANRLSKPTLNLFLADTREHPGFRDDVPKVIRTPDGQTQKVWPTRRIDMTYVVTAWAREAADEHRILSRALATMFRCDRVPEDHLVGDLVNARATVWLRIMPPDHITKPADFWGVMDNELRPNLMWVATAPLEAFAPMTGPMVRTSELRFSRPDRDWIENTFTVGGLVHRQGNQDEGISGAVVEVLGTTLRDTTDEEGRFTFAGVPAGERTWRVQPPEGTAIERQITVPSDRYDIEL